MTGQGGAMVQLRTLGRDSIFENYILRMLHRRALIYTTLHTGSSGALQREMDQILFPAHAPSPHTETDAVTTRCKNVARQPFRG